MGQTIIETFYPVDIANVAVKFKDDAIAKSFGCTGTLSGETEMRVVSAKCGGVTLEEKSKPVRMTGTISAFVKVDVYRRIFGIKNEGLKPGVYSYGTKSLGEEFTLTADIVDDFKDVTKVIAFPKANSSVGLTFTIDTSSDEVAQLEISFTELPDEAGEFYYEGFVDEMTKDLADQWRKNFSYDLVKEDGVEQP
ncbi:phage tail protein [Enterococcus wangshanyuanii]|uniref:Phage tail protein n=1 Tax=Enterococcus wangshanyuanii TaxID=2005703 RepID=A0ABQ1NSD2_9ENTE|nr:phage tail protein [Enterococcus wangshanyuanii]GGC84265.1 hypothetical protein GCM10011573_12340 [Enterococcus wangshanyuanii]